VWAPSSFAICSRLTALSTTMMFDGEYRRGEQSGRAGRPSDGRRRGSTPGGGLQHVGDGVRAPRQPPGQAAVQDQAHGVHVGGSGGVASAETLGRQIRCGADDFAVDAVLGVGDDRGDPEVENFTPVEVSMMLAGLTS
jgi:hypothetical protein